MSTAEQKYADLKKTLEKEGERGVKELQKQKGLIPPEKDLLTIMQKGADTFEKEMGRAMSYGEMREMYG